jgi:hypothetical protein
VDAVLGLVLLAVFAACIIALAAAMTWIVVRVSPTPDPSRRQSDPPKLDDSSS